MAWNCASKSFIYLSSLILIEWIIFDQSYFLKSNLDLTIPLDELTVILQIFWLSDVDFEFLQISFLILQKDKGKICASSFIKKITPLGSKTRAWNAFWKKQRPEGHFCHTTPLQSVNHFPYKETEIQRLWTMQFFKLILDFFNIFTRSHLLLFAFIKDLRCWFHEKGQNSRLFFAPGSKVFNISKNKMKKKLYLLCVVFINYCRQIHDNLLSNSLSTSSSSFDKPGSEKSVAEVSEISKVTKYWYCATVSDE